MMTQRPTRQELAACHAAMIRCVASLFASSGLRRCVHTVKKIMIDRNPISTVGKCAGFFRSGRRRGDCWRGELLRARTFGGVAELRPPSAHCSAFILAVYFRPLRACEPA